MADRRAFEASAVACIALALATLLNPKGAGVSLAEVALLALVAAMGTVGFLRVASAGRLPRGSGPLLALALWALLALANGALTRGLSLGDLRRGASLVALPAVALFVASSPMRRRDVRWVVGGLLVVVGVAFALNLAQFDASALGHLRDRRFRNYSLGFTGILGVALLLPYVLSTTVPLARRLLLGAFSGVLLLDPYFSDRRTYFVSLALTLPFGFHLIGRHEGTPLMRRAATVAAALVVAAIAAAPVEIWSESQRLADRFGHLDTDPSFQNRLQEIRGIGASLGHDLSAALVGEGPGASFSFFSVSEYGPQGIGDSGARTYSHNFLAYLVFSTGAVGLFLFALVLASAAAARDAWRPGSSLALPAIAVLLAAANLVIASLATTLLTNIRWAAMLGLLLGLLHRMAALESEAPRPEATA